MAHTTSGRDDVLIYDTGGSVPVNTYDVPATDYVATRDLAWIGDLKKLFIITQQANNTAPNLSVLSNPTRHSRLGSH